jgi:hydroxymethylpyrimidine kinase / phosphomethylpyrimidine kinase / thiamine-phosphate diphosphorylase
MERYRVIQELKTAIAILKENRMGRFIPEVASNLGFALPHAEGFGDVAAFPGRILRFKDTVATVADPEFDASHHIARIILTVMAFAPDYCSAMNIRYSKETVTLLKKSGFRVASFDRRLEPKIVKQREGSSLEWGVGEVLKRGKGIPDFIFDEGDVGKEPMIRVLGKTPTEVIKKIISISDFRSQISD